MAIGRETHVEINASQNNTDSVNCGTQANRFLVVVLGNWNDEAPTTITYDSVAMTEIGRGVWFSNDTCWVYGLVNPSSGSNNLVVNWPSAIPSEGAYITAIPYYGVDQTSVAAAVRDTDADTAQSSGSSFSLTGIQSTDMSIGAEHGPYNSADTTWTSITRFSTFSGSSYQSVADDLNVSSFSNTYDNDGCGVGFALIEASGPNITDVDTDETWDDGDTGLVITGTGFVT